MHARTRNYCVFKLLPSLSHFAGRTRTVVAGVRASAAVSPSLFFSVDSRVSFGVFERVLLEVQHNNSNEKNSPVPLVQIQTCVVRGVALTRAAKP